MYRIAIVEDDSVVSDEFKAWLLEKWPTSKIQQYMDFGSAEKALKTSTFDLVISDIDLGTPGDRYDGVRIARMLKSTDTPVLVVSGAPEPEIHRGVFMALDAWDYMQKPVSGMDFLNQARKALEWRASQHPPSPSSDPHLQIEGTRVTWKGKKVNLSMTRFRLVSKLASKVDQIATYDELFDCLTSGRNKENLRVHIQNIRDAFSDVDPEFDRIANAPIAGYSWRV
jgi:two-component system, OmpR family, response regulator ChvI